MEFDRRYAAVGIVIILLLLVGGSGFINVSTSEEVRDVNDYGSVEVISGSSTVESSDTIQASNGLVVIWTAKIAVSDINTWLYTASGLNLEKGVHSQDGSVHTFTFTLDGAPQGTTEMHVAFGGFYTETISWVGSTVHFYVEQDATPSFPAPEFTQIPEDRDMEIGEQAQFQWWFIYSGPAVARIAIDGITVSSRATTQTTSPQPLSYYVSFSDAGVHKVKLIIEPEYDIPYASEVTVTVAAASVPTTTPTVTVTTPTSTPTTGPPTPPLAEDPLIMTVSAIAFVAIVAVIIYIQLRGRSD